MNNAIFRPAARNEICSRNEISRAKSDILFCWALLGLSVVSVIKKKKKKKKKRRRSYNQTLWISNNPRWWNQNRIKKQLRKKQPEKGRGIIKDCRSTKVDLFGEEWEREGRKREGEGVVEEMEKAEFSKDHQWRDRHEAKKTGWQL